MKADDEAGGNSFGKSLRDSIEEHGPVQCLMKVYVMYWVSLNLGIK